MTSDDVADAALECLSRLPALSPHPARAQRTRRRCRASLERARRAAPQSVSATASAPRVLVALAVGGFGVFCALYLSVLLSVAVRFHSLLR